MGEALFHNHAAIFGFLPETHPGYQLENEIVDVTRNGEFIGMEHLLDNSTFKKGVLGISYVRSIVRE